MQSWLPSQFETGLVSVIIPTYQRADLLGETIHAFCEQTYRPLEIIVVEDGETRETRKLVEQLSKQNTSELRVTYLGQKNSGACKARNHGAENSNGEFLVFTDDDDLPSKDFVEERMRVARREAADLVIGPWQRFQAFEEKFYLFPVKNRSLSFPPNELWRAFLNGTKQLLQSCLISRSLVAQVGPWEESLHKAQDLDYKARIYSSAKSIGFSKRGTIFYRMHPQSISGQATPEKTASIKKALQTVIKVTNERTDEASLTASLADYCVYASHRMLAYGDQQSAGEFLRQAKQLDKDSIDRNLSKLEKLCLLSALRPLVAPLYHWRKRLSRRKGSATPSSQTEIVDALPLNRLDEQTQPREIKVSS